MKNINNLFQAIKIKLVLQKKHKRIFLLIFFLLHLLLILTVCVYSAIDSYISFYKEDSEDFKYPHALENTNRVLTTSGIYHYTIFAGIDAGYGFFAPNVASEYILEFVLKNNKNKVLGKITLPPFKSKESVQQYSAMLNTFQDKLKYFTDSSKTNPLYMRYLDVIIKSMAKNIIKKNARADMITATLYIYNYPSLTDYHNGNHRAQLTKMEQFNVFKN